MIILFHVLKSINFYSAKIGCRNALVNRRKKLEKTGKNWKKLGRKTGVLEETGRNRKKLEKTGRNWKNSERRFSG
jgi:hypothetical protein